MGIFAKKTSGLFKLYDARIRLRDRLMGGIPKNPKLMEGWIRSKAGVEQEEEVRRMMLRTLLEMGAEVTPDMSFDAMEKASEKLAAVRQTNGFKTGENGLYIEQRALKSMLKESVNILYAGKRWGVTNKGPKSFFAERVFVAPDRIWLGRSEPDGVELFIGHVTGREGPRSTITYHEYVSEVVLQFRVMVLKDEVKHEHWPEIWTHAEQNGLGALRSQGFGTFDVEQWDIVDPKQAKSLEPEQAKSLEPEPELVGAR